MHACVEHGLLESCTRPVESCSGIPSLQKEAGKRVLSLARQLIGNHDEVTDLRLLGPQAAPSHLALATNSPTLRLFDCASLSCTATLAGHTDSVLVLDAVHVKGTPCFFPCPHNVC